MPSDDRALILAINADIRSLERQMRRAVQVVEGEGRQMERSAANTARNIERSFAGINVRGGITAVLGSVHGSVLERGAASAGVFGSALSAIGPAGFAAAAGIAAMGAAIQGAVRTAEWAEELGDVANELHLSTTRLQELEFAATEAGAPVEAMRTTLRGLQQALGAALGSNDRAGRRFRAVFEELGISPEQLRSLRDVGDLLPLIAQGLNRVGEARAARIGELLHINPEILHELEEGRSHIEELITSARRYGVVMDEELVRRSGEAADAMRTASAVMNAELRVAFAELTPAVITAAGWFVRSIQAINGFATAMGDTIRPVQRLIEELGRLRFPQIPEWLRTMMNPQNAGPGNIRDWARFFNPLGAQNAEIWDNVRAQERGRRTAAEHRRTVDQLAVDNVQRQFELGNAAAGIGQLLPGATVDAGSGSGRGRGRGGGGRGRGSGGGARSTPRPQTFDNHIVTAIDDWIRRTGPYESFEDAAAAYNANREARSSFFSGGVQQETSLSGFTSNEATMRGLDEGLTRNHEELQRQWEDIISGGLDAAIRGGWEGLAQYMAQTLQRALVDNLSSTLARLLSPDALGNGGLFGKGGIASVILHAIPGFASGTTSAPGGLAWVGEKGPELINLPRGSQVIPAGLSAAMARVAGAGNRGGDVRMHMSVSLDGATGDRQIRQLILQSHAEAVSSALALARRQAPTWVGQRQTEGR